MCPKKLTNFDFDLSDALGKRKQHGFWKHSAPTSLQQLLLRFHDLVHTFYLFSFSLWFIFVFIFSRNCQQLISKDCQRFPEIRIAKQLFCTTHTVHFRDTHPSPQTLNLLQAVGCWDWEFWHLVCVNLTSLNLIALYIFRICDVFYK